MFSYFYLNISPACIKAFRLLDKCVSWISLSAQRDNCFLEIVCVLQGITLQRGPYYEALCVQTEVSAHSSDTALTKNLTSPVTV